MLGWECARLNARLLHLQTHVADRIVDYAEDEFGPVPLWIKGYKSSQVCSELQLISRTAQPSF